MTTDLSHLSESICDKARATVRQRWAAEQAEAIAKEQAFIMSIVGDQFTRNEDGSYRICAYDWVYLGSRRNSLDPRLVLKTNWKGLLLLTEWESVRSLDDLGSYLLEIDRMVALYEKRYPNTFWGRIRLWFATH